MSETPEETVVAYHERTKHFPQRYAASLGYLDWASQPDPFRRYRGAAFYRNLFWEAGMVGQVLYLEAEASGVRATGIGCYYDDAVHATFGLRSRDWQSLYHFTVGGPLEDHRLTTLPAYETLLETDTQHDRTAAPRARGAELKGSLMPLSETLRKDLTDLVTAHSVVLFMKGSRRAPQCGFSAQVVQILDGLVPTYHTVDVLASPEIRDGIKQFSDWPTIPQLYVRGAFVGGCDIVRDLYASGELQKLLGSTAPSAGTGAGAVAGTGTAAGAVESSTVKTPTIRVTPAARKAFEAARADAGSDPLRFAVDAQFQYDLYFAPREAGDVVVDADGLTIVLDRASAERADGVSIDFIDGPMAGFKIDNPHEPVRVKPLPVQELAGLLERGAIQLFDVRPEAERAVASLRAARPLDAAGESELMKLDRDTPIAMLCHHGVRSRHAAEKLIAAGFRKVYNVTGGIDAWSQTVDSSVRRY